MSKAFSLALTALPIMLIFDLTWVGIIANTYYRSQLGYLYAPHTVWQAAALFYVIYVLGLAYFVLAPSVRAHSLRQAVWNAAFFGLVAYGTYDLTNLAVTTNWPAMMSFVDMAWGVICAVVTTTFTYLIATKIYKF